MTTKETKRDSSCHFNQEGFRKKVETLCSSGMKQFKKIIRSYLFFHFFFLTLLAAEIIAFSIFLTFLFQSSYIAFSLAGILLTGFAYLILLFYFQTKKPEQFCALRNWFMLLCQEGLPKNLKENEHHLSLAHAAYRFSSHLSDQASPPSQLSRPHLSIHQIIQRFSHFCHRKDLLKMKEILLLVSINEHIELIKDSPTNLEAHASLANAYVALSRLYKTRGRGHPSKECVGKFHAATKKAVQEFQIIDHYCPNDPWVHAQIAICYRDLQMHREEIKSYELILKLCPNDKQIMFRLGMLYFQKGLNAKGLEIYARLKELNFSRTDELINFYDANTKGEYDVETL